MNDLATLKTKLATALRDPSMEVWEEGELEDLLTWACASMYPKVALPMSLPVWPLVAGEEDYDLPGGILEVSRIDLCEVDTDSLLYPLPSGTWEIQGDVWSNTARLFVNSRYADAGHYLVVHGYGTYNLSTGTPPDHYVPYIMAAARAEAIRRMLPKRVSFEKWMTLNQKENVSVNELGQMLGMAESQAERELSRLRTWRKPKPAR